ncbi:MULTISPECIES: hypothetical protein [unclassified Variovorax]|uniref:hypothetical protein n=1 Tax=unclassified Variovorax TaxID=663243 RepID=UPI002577433A|nr:MULTISPECIES: hypothetical protein [unclassified Variovorax]MDM0090469.1 hypothetical protein [Variovorax sp. J22G40]MDM0147866.1 hypothetical protein [Variovorax sp. J2P1-31]
MKVRTFSATLALASALGLGIGMPSPAEAAEPCEVFLCMAGVSGYGSPGPGCTTAIAAFHAIQIWSPKFNAPATALARRTYLMGCPGATSPNQAILEAIIVQWGYTP